MVIDGNNVDEIKEHLSEHFQAGYKWVAFKPHKANLETDIRCFKKFSLVADHCAKEREFFKPIASVLRSKLYEEGYVFSKKIDPQVLSNEILRFPIEPFRTCENLQTGLSKGELFPVYLKRKIDPEREILEYNIYEHWHPRGELDEWQEKAFLRGSFQSANDAVDFFENYTKSCAIHSDGLKPELNMIGVLNRENFEIEVDGIPVNNSGLLLERANLIYDSEKAQYVYIRTESQSLNSLEVKQPTFAKYNTSNSQLELFNGNLEKVQPAEKIPYMPLEHFSTKPVEILNTQKQTISSEHNDKSLSPKNRIS